MKRQVVALAAVAATLVVTAAAPAETRQHIAHVSPVARVPFPERGYVVDLPRDASIRHDAVHVAENGKEIRTFAFEPLATSGLRFGTVLAVDSSLSMKGKPYAAAIAAAKQFVSRRAVNQRVGLVTFNGLVDVLQRPTANGGRLSRVLAHPPKLAYGTRIFDGLGRSLTLLGQLRATTGAVVLLSDGADVGSASTRAKVIADARARHVRVFTVGLRSKAFDSSSLETIATETGGEYTEAASTEQLAPIYAALGERLAGEYLLQYRSLVPPKSHVDVRLSIDDVGTLHTAYTAPTPAGLPPYHRSVVARFLLSPLSLILLTLFVAGVAGLTMRTVLDGTRSRLVERVGAFVPGEQIEQRSPQRPGRAARRAAADRAKQARGWFASLERDLEIADVQLSATRIVVYTIGATGLAFVLLALVSPVIALIAFLIPFVARGLVGRRLKGVRDEFSEQLPPSLQILASALRSGHSFSSALGIVVDNAHDPSRRELSRAVADDQLGVDMDEAINRVATRMASRDLEQVALLAELQRTTGGNAAEVLDTVVDTLRDRADVRRLVKTLTAQGRMSRWILTALPIVTGVGFYLLQPDVMRPMVESTGGQLALVCAAFMVAAGSVAIQRIVDIKV